MISALIRLGLFWHLPLRRDGKHGRDARAFDCRGQIGHRWRIVPPPSYNAGCVACDRCGDVRNLGLLLAFQRAVRRFRTFTDVLGRPLPDEAMGEIHVEQPSGWPQRFGLRGGNIVAL